MYVYLLQGAESGEDCDRQRGQLVVVKPNFPVKRREEKVRHTLEVIAAPSCVRQCECTRDKCVQV